MDRRSIGTWLLAALLVAGCGGGETPSTLNLNGLSGVYTNELIIDAQGRFVANVSSDIPPSFSNYATFSGTLGINGTALSSPAVDTVQYHCAYENGVYSCATDKGTATLAGSFDGNLNVALQLSPAFVYPMPANLTFFRSSQAEYPEASRYIVSGRYVSATTGADFTITDVTGHIAGTAFTGCGIDGTVSVWNPARNVYSVAATLSGAACNATPGKTYDLLGYLSVVGGKQQLRLIANVDGAGVSVTGARI